MPKTDFWQDSWQVSLEAQAVWLALRWHIGPIERNSQIKKLQTVPAQNCISTTYYNELRLCREGRNPRRCAPRTLWQAGQQMSKKAQVKGPNMYHDSCLLFNGRSTPRIPCWIRLLIKVLRPETSWHPACTVPHIRTMRTLTLQSDCRIKVIDYPYARTCKSVARLLEGFAGLLMTHNTRGCCSDIPQYVSVLKWPASIL